MQSPFDRINEDTLLSVDDYLSCARCGRKVWPVIINGPTYSIYEIGVRVKRHKSNCPPALAEELIARELDPFIQKLLHSLKL